MMYPKCRKCGVGHAPMLCPETLLGLANLERVKVGKKPLTQDEDIKEKKKNAENNT